MTDCYYKIQFNSMSENTKNNGNAKIKREVDHFWKRLFNEIAVQDLIFKVKSRFKSEKKVDFKKILSEKAQRSWKLLLTFQIN